MPKADYAVFEALNPFFEIIQKGLSGLVDGEHYFDTIADDAFFEFRYHFPGWPLTIRGRANLMASFSGYGKTIKLHSGDALVVHHSRDSRVVILEYEVHGMILSSGAPYDNRFISAITIQRRKIVHWRPNKTVSLRGSLPRAGSSPVPKLLQNPKSSCHWG